MTLSIPHIDDEQDTLSAALAYAKNGWYILPVHRASKHAGSVLGKGWPAKSSRDPEQIITWFAGTDHALALHVGRSGAIAFDVDKPTELPPLLRVALFVVPGPFQSTREAAADAERGHYLYSAPDNRQLGNSSGTLGKSWGEVRGRNGIIVVAPSEHEKAAQGGRYAWARTGPLPELPPVLAEQLPDAADANDAATDREIRAFLEHHTGASRPELFTGVLTQWATALATGESRHQIMLRTAAGAMREAAAGLYSALNAAEHLQRAFIDAMSRRRDRTERILPPGQARAEFGGILAWAIAQVPAADLDAVREAVDERLQRDDFSGLIAPVSLATPPGPPPFDDTPAARFLDGNPDDDSASRTSWWPRTLDAVLTGVEEEVPPAFLARADGICLFYAGKVNALLGESESGKTWVALLAVAQALAAGLRVTYLDFEDTAKGIVGRLRALGVPDHQIATQIAYIGPDEILHATASADLREHMDAFQPALIILDGWNAAMTLLGLDLISNTDATRFAQLVLKPLAASGAAVVGIDHVTKSKETRGKGGIGAQAKRAMITGCSIYVEVAEPFGRGMTGRLRLYVDKDRAGHVRAISAEAKFAGTAVLESDAATGSVSVSIRTPDMGTRTERATDKRSELMESVCEFLRGNPQATGNAIRKGVEGRNDDVNEAVEQLVRGEFVVRRTKGQAYIHTLVRMYSALEELGGVSVLPVPVPSGHGGHGTEKPTDTPDLPVPARIGARLGHGSGGPPNRAPALPMGGPGTVEAPDPRDPSDLIAPRWIEHDGYRIDTDTGEILTQAHGGAL